MKCDGDRGLVSRMSFFDRLAREWNVRNGIGSLDPAEILPLIDRLHLKRGATLLDLGGGGGRLAHLISSFLPVRCLVMDLSFVMVASGMTGPFPRPLGCVQGDAHVLPLADCSVDHTVCYSAFPHFSSQKNVLLEVRRVLKNGGDFLLFHSTGRHHINDFHSRQEEIIASDFLPPLERFRQWGANQGWEIKRLCDEPERFIVHYRKASVFAPDH